ncbi:MAG: hypothetical protein ACYDCJ_12980 [Gammaproteobacteria bacterium]
MLFFLLANAATEWLNRKTMNPLTQPMSAYLTNVPMARLQQLGFFGLAVAEVLLAFAFMPDILASVGMLAAAGAVTAVVETKRLMDHAIGNHYTELEKWHVFAAGVAFVVTDVVLLRHFWMTQSIGWYAAVGAPIFSLMFYKLGPTKERGAVEEKVSTLLLMVSILAL